MPSRYPAGLVWFRRDLRVHDHAALSQALRHCGQVHGTFVFDRAILDGLPRADRRVEFIRDAVEELHEALRALAPRSGLIVRHAFAADEIPRLARALGVQAVFANHDWEPAALARDARVRTSLERGGIAFHTFKDQVVFEGRELQTQNGAPYSVFTPYRKAWLAKVDEADLRAHEVEPHAQALAPRPPQFDSEVPGLATLGFERTNLHELGIAPGTRGARTLFADFQRRIDRYHLQRDFPAVRGPSYLSVHLRFGTVSVRELAREAHRRARAGSEGAATWLSELIWRDFFFQVLANFDVADASGMGRNFRREFDRIDWEHGPHADELFAAWCEGRTGYPLVDAAMLQLLRTGYMHNRLRMVTASFLVKDLGIDWRRGERFFARHLLDYDLAANNGGWQWAASTGCDAQPYFRIFNPLSQSRRFDPDGAFVARYLPQLAALDAGARHAPWQSSLDLGGAYPRPIVDHDAARARTLQRYAAARKNGA